MSRRVRIFLICSPVALAVYVAVFSYWWFQSPVKVEVYGGKEVRIVEFHFNRVIWHTGPLWMPAFWFVEHVCGYKRGGFAPMEEESVLEYLK